ncbi:HTH-type transcriptional activator RhaR [bioreactor metagenome]|uniref:HTH-type transcriptional activator RhaR n=1 Tax=bioreactor metagenome TaxID=1076179 RepID=A0A645BD29_9ZZZZ
MDKTLIVNDENNGLPQTYFMNFRPGAVQKDFGFWIIMAARNNSSSNGIHEEPALPSATRKPRVFKFYSIAHMFDGAGFHWNAQRGITKLKVDDIIITPPDYVHFYGACKNPDNLPFVEDFISFAGPIADNLFKTGVIKDRIVNMGQQRRLLPIIDKALSPTRESQIEANILLLNFLTEIYIETQKASASELNIKFDFLTQKIIRDLSHWWTSAEMAEFCGVCESYFRVAFQQYSGLRPKHYVDKIKMGVASEKLLNSDIKLRDLAIMLGYLDQYHFSRRFKHVTGVSPAQYRHANKLLG